MPTKNSGFTLIEILVVLLIISIASSVALFSIGQNENRQLETVANELTQTLSLAEEQAMLQPNVLGLTLASHSWQFSSFSQGTPQKKANWQPLQDSLFAKHRLPKNIEIRVAGDSKRLPQVIISTNGEITPFTLYVGRQGKQPRYVIKGNADGTVTQQLLS